METASVRASSSLTNNYSPAENSPTKAANEIAPTDAFTAGASAHRSIRPDAALSPLAAGIASPTAEQPKPTRAAAYASDSAALFADNLTIMVNGRQFHVTPKEVEVHSDPGDTNYTTLEIKWMEQGVEMRLYLYFQGDENSWWVDEARTYDGSEEGEWITYKGEMFRSARGSAFNAQSLTLRSRNSDRPGTRGQIVFDGLQVIAFESKPHPLAGQYTCQEVGEPGASWDLNIRNLGTSFSFEREGDEPQLLTPDGAWHETDAGEGYTYHTRTLPPRQLDNGNHSPAPFGTYVVDTHMFKDGAWVVKERMLLTPGTHELGTNYSFVEDDGFKDSWTESCSRHFE